MSFGSTDRKACDRACRRSGHIHYIIFKHQHIYSIEMLWIQWYPHFQPHPVRPIQNENKQDRERKVKKERKRESKTVYKVESLTARAHMHACVSLCVCVCVISAKKISCCFSFSISNFQMWILSHVDFSGLKWVRKGHCKEQEPSTGKWNGTLDLRLPNKFRQSRIE